MSETRNEGFWIDVCLHLILCKKEDGACEKCIFIRRVIDEEKSDTAQDYTWAEADRNV